MKIFFIILAFMAISVNTLAINEADKQTSFLKERKLIEQLAAGRHTPAEEINPEYWRSLARDQLTKRLQETPNLNQAKNIIFFLGDGMSLTTVAASRIRKGQLEGKSGEAESLSFEKFPHTGLSRTYCANAQVPDSACTSTAYLCGVKANIMTLGVSANVEYNNCSMAMDPANQLSSIADWAQKAGKSTGFITTTTLTHASPSGMYAHTANRFWECDTDVIEAGQDPLTCIDMAQQLIKQSPGRNLDLLMGGGMGKFLPNTQQDAHGKMGERSDGQDLLKLWKEMHPTGKLVTNRDDLLNINVTEAGKIMGIFGSSIMNFHALADPKKDPTLAEMLEIALKFFSCNKKGYLLFVEGGLIDYGNHANMAGLSTDETAELDKAVEVALKLTDDKDTLIVLSSDHGHPLMIGGNADRGAPILGINPNDVDVNGVHYATVNYAIGTEQYLDEQGQRLDLTGKIGGMTDLQPSHTPGAIGVHSGDDVGIFARGPYSHMFRGVLQQHSLPHIMAYAACIGDGPTMCDKNK